MANRVVHANVSEEAFQQWTEFADEHGISVTGIVEALGTYFEQYNTKSGSKALTGVLEDIALSARKVDTARRRRGRGGAK